MAKSNTFNGEYKLTTVLGEISNGRKVELGHYIVDGKEYGDKIYIRGSYTKRNGEQAESVTKTNLTLKDLAELQSIDLSVYDTDTNANEAFD